MLRFRIISLLAATSLIALAIVPCADYFGWIHPPRRVRALVHAVESLPEGTNVSEFFSLTGLPEGHRLEHSDRDYSWQIADGFELFTRFGPEEDSPLQFAVIYIAIPDSDRSQHYWHWHRDHVLAREAPCFSQ